VWLYSGSKRTIVGVNSKGNIRSVSYLSYTQKTKTLDFLRSWSASKGADICGVTKDCGATPPPPPPPAECAHEVYVVGFLKAELKKAEDRLRLCQK
jgi:hypothetical protein